MPALLATALPIAAVFLAFGSAKVAALAPMRARAAHLGFSTNSYRVIGTLEIAGAAGVLLGLVAPPLGALAAAGLLLLLAGAVFAHLRHRDQPRLLAPRLGGRPARRRLPYRPARRPTMNHPVIPVVIIGAGPTGLTAATLLAQHGVECLVLDRWDSIYPQPRAVHLDDEVYRILARLGIRDEFAAISRPCLGLRLVEPDMTVLAELDRDTDHGRHGYPQANMFDQPELEALLRANLPRHPSATLRGGTEVTALSQDDDGPVRVDVTDHVHGTSDTLLAAYVLGCDGANSIARTAIDAHMTDLKFDQRWLVVDVDTPCELAEWEGVHQVCDTRRAGTYMRIGDTRYRWEFRLGRHRDRRRLPRHHPPAPAHRALDQVHTARSAARRAGSGVHLPRPDRRPLA